MTALSDLITRVRVALGVDVSYEAVAIPDIINRAANRLLRDYNFPKSLRSVDLDVTVGSNEFTLPAGFKKEHMLRLYNPTDLTYGEALKKREGFTLPGRCGYAEYYWLLGAKAFLDTSIGLEYAACKLRLWYQAMDAATNLDWMAVDLADVIFTYAVYRGSADVRKPEVLQAYQPLWAEDRQSIAVYANELEFDNMDMIQHEAAKPRPARYPASV